MCWINLPQLIAGVHKDFGATETELYYQVQTSAATREPPAATWPQYKFMAGPDIISSGPTSLLPAGPVST